MMCLLVGGDGDRKVVMECKLSHIGFKPLKGNKYLTVALVERELSFILK